MWGWALAGAARAATVCVGAQPECLDSLQAALDDPANHTVEIWGLQTGPFVVDHDVTLIGMDLAKLRIALAQPTRDPLLTASGSLTIRGLTLESNQLAQNLVVDGPTVVLDEVVLSQGRAVHGQRGCARITADEVTVTRSSVRDCDHGGNEAGLWIEARAVTVGGTLFEGNDGPAMQILGAASATLDRLVVQHNGLEFRGLVGGVQLAEVEALSVTGSWFCDNVGKRGGALRVERGCEGGDCRIEHAVFQGNHAQLGAAVGWGGTLGAIRHSTFVDNSAGVAGHAILVGAGQVDLASNLIVEGSPAAGTPSPADPPPSTIDTFDGATVTMDGSALYSRRPGLPMAGNLALVTPPALIEGFVPPACGASVTVDPTAPDSAPFGPWPDASAIGALTTVDCGPWCEDGDGDGVPAMWDCASDDPARGMGLAELGDDGIDQDCDGLDICFQDPDGDGFGSDPVLIEVGADCGGAVSRGDDCDEGDPAVHPDATEVPGDGVDQDCDGAEVCYADADGDGVTGGAKVTGDLGCVDGDLGPVDEGDCDDGDPDLRGPHCAVRVGGGCATTPHGGPDGWLAGLGLVVLTRRRRGCGTGRR